MCFEKKNFSRILLYYCFIYACLRSGTIICMYRSCLLLHRIIVLIYDEHIYIYIFTKIPCFVCFFRLCGMLEFSSGMVLCWLLIFSLYQ